MAYRGVTVRLPVGAQGFTGTRNQSQAGPGHLIYVEGAELDGGIIRKDGGAKLLVELGQFTSMRSILHYDNAVEGATTITDDGFLIATWNAVGGAKTTLTDKKFGAAALTLNGTTDWVTSLGSGIPTGTDEFTVYTFFKCLATTGTRRNLFGQCDASQTLASTSIVCYRTTANVLRADIGTPGGLLSLIGTTQFTNLITPGWNMVAVVRDNSNPVSNKLCLFCNGHLEATTIISGPINTSSSLRAIGQCGAVTTNPWQGLVDESVVRIGVCMWTTDFTPPTQPTRKYGGGAEAPVDTPIPIIQGTSWAPTVGGDHDVVMLANGAVISDPNRDGTFPDVGVENLVVDREPPPYFCVSGGEDVGEPRKLFLFSRSNQVQVRQGAVSTFAPITTPPADWAGAGNFPTFGCVHEYRMFAGGNASDPHRIYYSSITDHEVFTGTGAGAAGTLPVFPGQGQKLAGAYSIRGALIIWKYPVGVYVLQTQDPDPTTWRIQVLSRAVGALNCNAIVQIENDVLYLDHSGAVHLLSATNEFGDFNTSNLSDTEKLAPFMKDEINRARLERAVGIYYTTKRQAWFYMPRKGDDVPNLRLQVGFEPSAVQQQGQVPPRFFMSRRDEASTVWLRPNPDDGTLKPAIGGENGCIYLLDDDARVKGYSQGYPISFNTANTDLAFADQSGSLATKTKNGQFLEIVYEPEGEWDLLVDIFWDDIFTATIPFNMGGAGGVLGTMVLGSDIIGFSGIRESRRRIPGSGRRFRMSCFNDGANQNVSIAEFHLSFAVGDERTPE